MPPSLIVTDFTIPTPFTHHSTDVEADGGFVLFAEPENWEAEVRVTSTLTALYVPALTVIDSSAAARLCSVVVMVNVPRPAALAASLLDADPISIVCELFQVEPALTFGGIKVPLDEMTFI